MFLGNCKFLYLVCSEMVDAMCVSIVHLFLNFTHKHTNTKKTAGALSCFCIHCQCCFTFGVFPELLVVSSVCCFSNKVLFRHLVKYLQAFSIHTKMLTYFYNILSLHLSLNNILMCFNYQLIGQSQNIELN